MFLTKKSPNCCNCSNCSRGGSVRAKKYAAPLGMDQEVDHLAVIWCRPDFHTRALPRSILALPLGVT